MNKKTRKYIAFFLIAAVIPISFFMAGNGAVYTDTAKLIIPESGCALYIDLDALLMTVYVDGNVLKTYPVSGGTANTPSPVGIWHVTEIYDWGKGFGGTWIGLNVPWGVYGIHGTKEPWLVGKKNVSHGCIRMKDEDAIEVKNLVTIGSSVQIKQDSLPFRNMGKSMTGSDVYNTQIMLKNLGFYTGTIDGIFGEGMERAVKSFQRTYYLEDDGIIGKTTYEKIIEQNRIKTG
ncbi:MAG TPA: L,D-transpeptidase family protein [Oscillospiraceae bacterium]|nr:L,D-transpeptidase family protein [Oscillospiraceae bacterium]HPK35951.1 L,D-transpeptidase family protein [Oscillospiraceae bacterium]HPR75644.1 L,D-transpeptidase family protein [Oscillospiraceae bacterium]